MSLKLMIIIVIITILTLIPVNTLYAQHTFECTYGGAMDDRGAFVQQLTDESYIIAGTTTSYGSGEEDIYLIKVDILGDTIWTKTFGYEYGDVGICVQRTSDQGFIIAGYKLSSGMPSGSDPQLIKSDPDGNQIWAKTYGISSKNDYGYSVRQTSDGGYIIAGDINQGWPSNPQYDVYLLKTDSSGFEQWAKTYNGMDQDMGACVQLTSDDGYVISGSTGPWGSFDVYFIKTNSSGDTLWTRTYGGTGSDQGSCVQLTSDDGYIIAGYTNSYGNGGYDVYLIKTDSSGDTLWTRTYGGTDIDYGTSLQQTSDDGYIIAGYTKSFGAGDFDVYLIKTDSSGDTMWTKTYGGTSVDWANSVQQTSDGGYIIAGYTKSFGAGDFDVYLIKTDAFGLVTNIGETVPDVNPASFHLAQNYPNPFNPVTTIKYSVPTTSDISLVVYDILGREIQKLVNEEKLPGNYTVQFDGTGLSSGIYFYTLTTGNFVESKKMTLMK